MQTETRMTSMDTTDMQADTSYAHENAHEPTLAGGQVTHTSRFDGSTDVVEDLDDEDDDENELQSYLIKPMSSQLAVCPVDDIGVEEEKRRRRVQPNNSLHHSSSYNDVSSLSQSFPGSTLSRQSIVGPRSPPGPATDAIQGNANGLSTPAPKGRDITALRHQYWSQLGFNLSRSDVERSTRHRRERRQGYMAKLNDLEDEKGPWGFSKLFSSWYKAPSDEDAAEPKDEHSDTSTSTHSSEASTSKKSVRFHDEAEMFFIPMAKEYSRRQRSYLWPTREEFITMVERNLDAVYDEMEREYEEQLRAEELEKAAMEEEEMRQRQVEAAARHVQMQRNLVNTKESVPTLALNPQHTQVKLTPRARTSHDLRFKYLKHLGIKNQ